MRNMAIMTQTIDDVSSELAIKALNPPRLPSCAGGLRFSLDGQSAHQAIPDSYISFSFRRGMFLPDSCGVMNPDNFKACDLVRGLISGERFYYQNFDINGRSSLDHFGLYHLPFLLDGGYDLQDFTLNFVHRKTDREPFLIDRVSYQSKSLMLDANDDGLPEVSGALVNWFEGLRDNGEAH